MRSCSMNAFQESFKCQDVFCHVNLAPDQNPNPIYGWNDRVEIKFHTVRVFDALRLELKYHWN